MMVQMILTDIFGSSRNIRPMASMRNVDRSELFRIVWFSFFIFITSIEKIVFQDGIFSLLYEILTQVLYG